MQWQDEAIILGISRFSESALRLEVLSREHGRYAGIVRGGASAKKKTTFDIGNILQATWKARLAEQLGSFTTELIAQPAAAILHHALALAALSSATSLVQQKMPERHAEPALYEALKHLLTHLENDTSTLLLLYVGFELTLLAACGFPLDLSACAGTGSREGLCYVSPKSGRAVSREAGAPYADRLLALPAFLTQEHARMAPPTARDFAAALKLTEYFLTHHAEHITHKPLPAARQRLVELMAMPSSTRT